MSEQQRTIPTGISATMGTPKGIGIGIIPCIGWAPGPAPTAAAAAAAASAQLRGATPGGTPF